MKIFLSFIGNNDCFPGEKPGAILSVLEQKKFDRAYLLYNHDRYLKPAGLIRQHCRTYFPKTEIFLQAAEAHDPIDYNLVYPAMYQAVGKIVKENSGAEFTVSLTSGTPTMHACWIFLVQGGVIDATLIQVSREAGISEVSFELDDFPKIRRVDEVRAEMTRLARENRQLKSRLGLAYDPIVGQSPGILKVKKQIKIFTEADFPVFVLGETGTGKELVAEAIHYNSPRREKAFIPVNCGAISPNLAESEFFGHKKGAFTGATADREGIFRQADGGTIFLDEVADLPPEMQVKLLRVLENGTFTPVGNAKAVQVNVRVISAANRDIRELVSQGKFREDLFYRLMVAPISLPSLRERGNDRLLIADHIVRELNGRYGKRKVLAKSAADFILKYRWPGNVRQLKNVLETAFVYPGDEISAENMHVFEAEPVGVCEIAIPDGGVDLNNDVLPQYYEAAMKKAGGNASEAARLLGMKPHTFRARLKNLKK